MSTLAWTYLWVTATFGIYIFIAIRSRVKNTEGFYVAGHGVPAIANGMATGADWMSAASFISMAGLIAFTGYAGSAYLMGWTGGYVLLALLLAPYLRKFGAFTVPDFVGDRYYSTTARVVALICAIFVSFTYVAGQMRGVGIVFSRFLEVPIDVGVLIGMVIVFLYATLGGMKGITWTQVAQYVVLIIAYLVPAVAISWRFTGNPIPQVGMGSTVLPGQLGQVEPGIALMDVLDKIVTDLGFAAYTSPPADGIGMWNVALLTLALMAGTAGLPHVIIRFYTTKTVAAARWSAFWALLFIAILYTTAPAVATFARANLIRSLHDKPYAEAPVWFQTWENSNLIAWVDKDGDGRITMAPGAAFAGKPNFTAPPDATTGRGAHGERSIANTPTDNANELYVDPDIMVLANPEIARLPGWVVGLVAAGGLAAALSTAAGLLLVISSSISHDLLKRTLCPTMSERNEVKWARVAAGGAVIIAGIVGIYPPAFVGQVVAFAFGLAASSFFPVIVLGIFWTRTTRAGAIAGMLSGMGFTFAYIVWYTYVDTDPANLPFGLATTGIGSIGMAINFIVTIVVTLCTPPPPEAVQAQVLAIRYPRAEAGFHADQESSPSVDIDREELGSR